MNTKLTARFRLSSLIGLLTMATVTFTAVAADIPDGPRSGGVPAIYGMYKVTSSNDPVFPMTGNQEWFLDFNEGMKTGKSSGSLAVSLRQNPNVRVRILAWQVFPETGNLLVGNPYHEGSRQAVALADWKMSRSDSAIVFARGNYQVVLRPAAAGDY